MNNKGKIYTKEDLLDNLKKVYEKYGYITKNTINDFGGYGDWLYFRKFNSLDEAMTLVGINTEENTIIKNEICFKTVREKTLNDYPKENLIKCMQEYVEKYGYPTTREFDKHKEYPSVHIYRKVFGSFEDALKESNIKISEDKQWLYDRQEYSKDFLLEKLKEYTEIKLKNNLYLLTATEIDGIKDMPNSDCYYRKLGSLKNAYTEIGINYDDFNLKQKEEDMKQKYIEIKNILGRIPHSRDLTRFSKENENYYYACRTYLDHFDTMRNLHKLMGDKPRNWTRDLSDEEMLETLRKLSIDLGIVPNQKEVELCEYCGSIVSYTKRFGSFVEAITKAGLIPRSKKEPLITPKGNKALSGYEYKFMLVLEQYNIDFKKEEFYKKYINGFKKNYRFDFTLEFDNEIFFIEIFGITGNKKYDAKVQEKIQLCKDNNLNLIEFYPNDIGHNSFKEIYELLMDNVNKLKQHRKDLI